MALLRSPARQPCREFRLRQIFFALDALPYAPHTAHALVAQAFALILPARPHARRE